MYEQEMHAEEFDALHALLLLVSPSRETQVEDREFTSHLPRLWVGDRLRVLEFLPLV